uniref:Uncharacterized protein n=1 Tax=Rhizophora mucronata TaxID=61149 RepID=A0A2P2QW10_RHIMU
MQQVFSQDLCTHQVNNIL